MKNLSRRTFLAAAGAGAALMVVPSRAASRIPLSREEHGVVVIGSGFGGGVAALRLAQAGVAVTVLERGKWWPTGPNADTFPRVSNPDKRALWYGSAPELFGKRVFLDPYVGLLDAMPGIGITALCAAGVGGGSLVYQGMTLQPSQDVFNACLPEALDYGRMAKVHYPRVARMLKAQTAPDALIESPTYFAARVFAQRVQAAGYGLEKIPMPIDWSYALAELRGEMAATYTNGDCALGVNNGGKHSVDVTYLKAALETGRVQVQTHHNVTGIARASDGRWEVTANRTDDAGTVLEHKILRARTLILAAGSLGTSKLLVQAAGRGSIRDLPDGVGEGWGTNGDRIYTWTNLQQDFGAIQGGPVIYGSKDWSDPARATTIIQASVPPLQGLDARSTMLVGFGVSPDRGRFIYNALADRAELWWPPGGDAASYLQIQQRLMQVVGTSGVLADTNAAANTTWHPLGGACMGTVCDLEGRVRGQRGLYVLDGALIPGSTAACNPSMTIAAVAERAMDRIVAGDVGTII